MRILLDTNILTRIAERTHYQHQLANEAVKLLTIRGETLCLVPQNFYEFWVVATRPIVDNGLGLTPEITLSHLNDLKPVGEVLQESTALYDTWEKIVVQYGVQGKSAHDARLVAAMMVHTIEAILTFNKNHFTRYTGITLLTPAEIVAIRT